VESYKKLIKELSDAYQKILFCTKDGNPRPVRSGPPYNMWDGIDGIFKHTVAVDSGFINMLEFLFALEELICTAKNYYLIEIVLGMFNNSNVVK
jgi:hypothetical protein